MHFLVIYMCWAIWPEPQAASILFVGQLHRRLVTYPEYEKMFFLRSCASAKLSSSKFYSSLKTTGGNSDFDETTTSYEHVMASLSARSEASTFMVKWVQPHDNTLVCCSLISLLIFALLLGPLILIRNCRFRYVDQKLFLTSLEAPKFPSLEKEKFCGWLVDRQGMSQKRRIVL